MQTKRLFNFLCIILSTVILLANTSLINGFTNVYYFASGIIAFTLYVLSSNNKKVHNIFVFFLYIACILSVVGNNIDPVFQSFYRFLIFAVITLLIGPAITSRKISNFRFVLFKYLLGIILVMVIVSFLLNITGMYNGYATNEGDVLMYQGLFQHTMVMSPMAAISFLVFILLYLKPYGYLSKIKRNKKGLFHFIMIGCVGISFLSSVMAGSRGAVGALIISSLFLFFFYSKFKVYKFLKIGIIVFLGFAFTFPLWKNKTVFLVSKVENNQNAGSASASRDGKWQQRIQEFQLSPIYGIGFGSVDPNGKDEFNRQTGQVEPGTSWLSILSMTGALGFLSTMLLFVQSFIKMYKTYMKTSNPPCVLIASMLVFFSIHMVVEGYFLFSGSLAFVMVWLTLGVANINFKKISYR